MAGLFTEADVVSCYSKDQAVEDGVLVDVSETAREAGIVWPVVVTRAVFVNWVEVPASCEGIQDQRGRLWDVVWVLSRYLRNDRVRTKLLNGEPVLYKLKVMSGRAKKSGKPKYSWPILKVLAGRDEAGSPYVTVLNMDED